LLPEQIASLQRSLEQILPLAQMQL